MNKSFLNILSNFVYNYRLKPDNNFITYKFLNILSNFVDSYRLKPDNNGNIIIKRINSTITELPFLPKYVNGKFDVSDAWLKTLKGSPEIVNGNFNCSNNNLKSLDYAPKIVKGNYNCGKNRLVSLKGSPEIINGNFDCYYMNQEEGEYETFETLEGGPKIVKGDFDCSNNELTSLKGAPQEVGGDFICNYCGNPTLEFCTKNIGGKLFYNKKSRVNDCCSYECDDMDYELKKFKKEVIKYQIKAKTYIGDSYFFNFEDIKEEFEKKSKLIIKQPKEEKQKQIKLTKNKISIDYGLSL